MEGATDEKKSSQILMIVISSIALMSAVCMIGWKVVNSYTRRYLLQDVYFIERGDVGASIYKYDVSKGKTVTVAVLKGGWYSDCKINRDEDYIIGEFWYFKEKTSVLLRYNLSDDTTEEITGKEAEAMIERLKETEDRLPERSSMPEEVRRIVSNKPISWSADGKTAVFGDGKQENIYLYCADVETYECVLKAGWNRTFGSNVGVDASGRYVFYQDNFNYLFGVADIKIVIYDTKTKMRIKIYKERYTTNNYEFVQDLSF